MTRRWNRYRRLASVERRRLLEAAVALLTLSFALRALGLRRCETLVRLVAGRRRATPGSGGCGVEEIVRAVGRASTGLNVGTCLSRTLAAQFMANRRGWSTRLQIGALRKDVGIEAHAWLEHDGGSVGEDPLVRGFGILERQLQLASREGGLRPPVLSGQCS